MMYNSGTAAFGSLIIAIIATLRVVLAYIQRKCSLHKNKVTEAIICCIGCCLWCFEKCVKFLNKNAYIQTAIYGYSFCKAARTAFFLLLRNILRVAAVNMVSGFVIMLGKVDACYLVLCEFLS
jgi:choline transporter-like protein 2/4/5